MGRNLIAVFCLIVFSVSLVGCATTNPDPNPSAGQSAVGGAVAGAVVGSAIGALCSFIPGGGIASTIARGAIAGAASGAVAGIIAGFVYGKYQERLARDRKAAEAYHHYKPEDGEKVVVETTEVTPNAPVQGEKVTLNSSFSVLTGTDDPVPVEVMQVVMSDKKMCGQPFCNATSRVSGTYEATLPMEIPANAPEGKYQLITTVKTAKIMEQKTYEFMIAKKAEPAAPEKAGTPEQPSSPEETGKVL